MSHNKSSALTAKNKSRLQKLLVDPHNKFCADCKTSRNPRWASWNLGVFICIRCSGMHRSLGTHVSRVKSVDLDSWTDEQTANMEQWGNQSANLYWEAKLYEIDANKVHHEGRGDGYVPVEGKVESFVRTKYALGKWKSSAHRDSFIAKPTTESSIPAAAAAPTPSSNANNNLLDDLLGNSNSQHASKFQPNVQQQERSKINPTVDLLKQTTSSASSVHSLPLASSNSQGLNRGDLKKNILSLYSASTNSSPNLHASAKLPDAQYKPSQYPSMGVSNSFNGTQSANSWANSNSSSTSSSNTGFVGEDPFKNVWK